MLHKISFWDDHWIGDGPLFSSIDMIDDKDILVADFWNGNSWKTDTLIQNGIHDHSNFNNIKCEPNMEDRIIIKNQQANHSLSKSICCKWTNAVPKSKWSKLIWNQFFRPSISFFSWRIFHNTILMDARLKTKGFRMPSICILCKSAEEDMTHLFHHCQFTSRVWKYFQQLPKFNIPSYIEMTNQNGTAWSATFTQLIPFIITWFIWKTRNLKYEDAETAVEKTINWITSYIKMTVFSVSIKEHQFGTKNKWLFQYFGGSPDTTIPKGKLVFWKKPKNGEVKINIDEAFSSTEYAGCGGIFKSCSGKCLAYYLGPTYAYSPLHAELLSCYWALKLAAHFPSINFWLESDSMQLINLFNSRWKLNVPWFMINLVKSIQAIYSQINIGSTHIHREANLLADYLASRGSSSNSPQIFCCPDGKLQTYINGDLFGLPYIRRCKWN